MHDGTAQDTQQRTTAAAAGRRIVISVDAMGGDALRSAGVDIIVDNRDLAVVGLVEVISHYPVIHRALKQLKKHLDSTPPDLLILVDYVEFNLKLARHAKGLGIPVLFYISPQVWAWRPKRVRKIGWLIDMMAVIFPFEAKFYEQHGIPVRYVGNPLVGHVEAACDREQCRQNFGIDTQHPVVGLLPGSRRSEIRNLLPLFLQTATLLQQTNSEIQFLLPLAPGLNESDIEPLLHERPDKLQIITGGKTYEVMRACDAILTASGTATLETALMEIPMVMAYRTAPLTYAILKRMVKIPHIALVNIVAEKSVVREFMQNDATADNLSREVQRLLSDASYRRQMVQELKKVREKLGNKNGSENIAKLALEMIGFRE